MATISARTGSGLPNVARLSAGQAGNAVSTNIADLGLNSNLVLLTLVVTAGATPTCTYAIEGSANGQDWWAVQWADTSTPDTWGVATFTITAAGVTQRVIRGSLPFRYLRVIYSANTNIQNTADVYVF